jgi:hypothetical protein
VVILAAVISVDNEKLVLAEYEALLADAQAELAEKRRAVVSLQTIVTGIRERLQVLEPDEPDQTEEDDGAEEAPEPAAEAPASPAPPAAVSIRYGKPTLMAMVREVMADGRSRDVDGVVEALLERDALPDSDARQKVNNRLSELVQLDYLTRVRRGVYVLKQEQEAQDTNSTGGVPGGLAEAALATAAGVTVGAGLAHVLKGFSAGS